MENQPKLNNSKEVIAYLAERFPLCFITEGNVRPLKIGIFKDLVERLPLEEGVVSKTQLRSALRLYTSSWRYLHGVKAGVQRVDLDGNPCGVLEAEHIEYACKQLEEAKARIQVKRIAQQAQKREATEALSLRSSTKKTGARHERQRDITTRKNTSSCPQNTRSPGPKTVNQQNRRVGVDITQLQVGQDVRVKVGKSSMDATILEIAKDGIRVQLSSGLAMIVRAEHLQF